MPYKLSNEEIIWESENKRLILATQRLREIKEQESFISKVEATKDKSGNAAK
jgi:hypothetical protein